ncbi:WhiB family transcriptional regulator [Chitinophaga sp.]|uniref:WhiB family transcriptional regulator n=1 Tax=Chitinophaga sp. TaxID=1869181 RepID=UPI0039C8A8B2
MENDWQLSAECRNVDSDIFFTEDKKDRRFKDVCNMCPVIGECLDYALIYNVSGTWGGMTEKERSKIPRKQIMALRDDYDESGLFDKTLKA